MVETAEHSNGDHKFVRVPNGLTSAPFETEKRAQQGPFDQVLQFVKATSWQARAAAGVAVLLLLILMFSGGNSSSDVPSEFSNSPIGLKAGDGKLCQLDYTVRTWEGKRVPVCDLAKCQGREQLKVLEKPEEGEVHMRWSEQNEADFLESYNNKTVQGWVHPPQIDFVKLMTRKQLEMGVYGAVGEIGVHHGKFFMPIAGNALSFEPLVAIDLFEEGQHMNFDKSGNGSRVHFLTNARRFGIQESEIVIKAVNSRTLSVEDFVSWGLPFLRILSVDGGHSLETTLSDLMVASCVVRDGGLVILDDFPMSTWMGVAEALAHFTNAQDRLVPFLTGWNKVWLTTASHVDAYEDYVRSKPDVFACRNLHASKLAMGGRVTCYTGPSNY